jgi:hypothetical protein
MVDITDAQIDAALERGQDRLGNRTTGGDGGL